MSRCNPVVACRVWPFFLPVFLESENFYLRLRFTLMRHTVEYMVPTRKEERIKHRAVKREGGRLTKLWSNPHKLGTMTSAIIVRYCLVASSL